MAIKRPKPVAQKLLTGRAHDQNAGTSTRGAQKFPDAASFKISLSSVRSETARRRRSFSFCSRFNSLSGTVRLNSVEVGKAVS